MGDQSEGRLLGGGQAPPGGLATLAALVRRLKDAYDLASDFVGLLEESLESVGVDMDARSVVSRASVEVTEDAEDKDAAFSSEEEPEEERERVRKSSAKAR